MQVSTPGCDAALASAGVGWTGLEMEGFVWGDFSLELEPIDDAPVDVCIATGPPELLPVTQGIGCILVGGELAQVDGQPACAPLSAVRQETPDLVYWIERISAVSSAVSPLYWNGAAFETGTPFLICGEDLTPVADENVCFQR
jgi:hypothetical protein